MRYLLLVLAIMATGMVACSNSVPDEKDEWHLISQMPSFSAGKSVDKTVETTCVRIKSTGELVSMSDWMRMGLPETDLRSIAQCPEKKGDRQP